MNFEESPLPAAVVRPPFNLSDTNFPIGFRLAEYARPTTRGSPGPPFARRPGLLFAQAGKEHAVTLVLLMVFVISVAMAVGFILGRIYQIRRDELARRVASPPGAHVPRPTG